MEFSLSALVRFSIIFAGVWYFAVVLGPGSFVMLADSLFGLEESSWINRFFSIFEFCAALLVGLLVSHAVFWPCIVRPRRLWPKWGEPAIKSLDFLWYGGAIAGALFAAALAQFELVDEVKSRNATTYDFRNEFYFSALEEVPERCEAEFNQPPDGASQDYQTAYAVVIQVCRELDDAGADRNEHWVVDAVVKDRCELANVDYWPPGAGQSFSDDLWGDRSLLNAYSSVIGVCLNAYHMERISKEFDEVDRVGKAVAFADENPLRTKAITWFALLLAFRLTKTTSEVLDAMRNAVAR